MQFRVFPPHPGLRHLVKEYYVVESTFQASIQGHIVPDGHLEIGLSFGDDFEEFVRPCNGQARWITKPSAYVDSLMDRYIVARSTGKIGLFGVKLRYAAGHTLFPFGVLPLRNGPLALEHAFGTAAYTLEDRVAKASTHRQRIAAFDDFFLTLLRGLEGPDKLLQAASNLILARQGNLKVGDVARRLGVSRRYLGKRFNACLGLTPKRFAQITRVRSIIDYFARHPQVSLTKIAYTYGYFDQSHFIKEFKSIAGLAPGMFFEQPHFVSDLIQSREVSI